MGIAASGPDIDVVRALNEHELLRFSCDDISPQDSETLRFVMRPLAAWHDASPAALRLASRRTADGVSVDIVKRKGPIGVEPCDVVLKHWTALLSPYGRSSKLARKLEPSPH